MNTRWLAFGSSAMLLVCIGSWAHAQGDAPDDKAIASAIARGVAFLKETQSDQGHWDEPAQRDHRLGMTAAGPTSAGGGFPARRWHSSSCAKQTSLLRSIVCFGCRTRRAIPVSRPPVLQVPASPMALKVA